MRWIGFALVGVVAGMWVLVSQTDWRGAAPRDSSQGDWQHAFRWRGTVAAGEWVYIRNLNGDVRVERSDGPEVEVTAEKKWRRSDPDDVEVVAVPHEGSVTICAIWTERNGSCGERGRYRHGSSGVRLGFGRSSGDVAVRFTVRVPDGVRVDGQTSNGGLRVDGAAGEVLARTTNGSIAIARVLGPVDARTTNGGIDAHTLRGPVTAHTTNGNITVRIDALPEPADLDFRTTNGTVTAYLPTGLSAEIDASLSNGRITTDFPIQVQGRLNPRHLRATLGSGGPVIRVRTTNGSIHLKSAVES